MQKQIEKNSKKNLQPYQESTIQFPLGFEPIREQKKNVPFVYTQSDDEYSSDDSEYVKNDMKISDAVELYSQQPLLLKSMDDLEEYLNEILPILRKNSEYARFQSALGIISCLRTLLRHLKYIQFDQSKKKSYLVKPINSLDFLTLVIKYG